MTGCKDWFFDLEEGFNRFLKFGNDTRMSVVGKGSVKVQVKGATQVIPEVYYVPELKNNLLSFGQLQERGLAILIRDGTCKVYHPKKDKDCDWNQTGVKEKILDYGEEEHNTEVREGDMACPPSIAYSSPSGSISSSVSGGNSTPPSPVSLLPSPISSSPSRSIEREVVAGPRARRTPSYLADYVTGEGEDEEESLSVMLLMMIIENDPVKFEEAVKDKVWEQIYKWLDMPFQFELDASGTNYNSFGFILKGKVQRNILLFVWVTVCWIVWLSINEIVFQGAVVRIVDVVDRIKVLAWNWFATRTKCVEAYCWTN
ncbi:hypothetical protein KIW84_077107 [Lathyrus oleraceus]|uniref:Retrovirus-related Pol polyprotein from transposon TNT 1-94-like beta-barrel domain-containing protein n=1 Tax=Pisum sativum TaxID=3888 RepID=A0A9D4VYN8_PEA|nr:hypothetical protein KIW84_077107 [Pisum sativum]